MQSFTAKSWLVILAALPCHAVTCGSVAGATVTVTVTVTASAASSTFNTNTCACPTTSIPSAAASSTLSLPAAASSSTISPSNYPASSPSSSSTYSSTLISSPSSSSTYSSSPSFSSLVPSAAASSSYSSTGSSISAAASFTTSSSIITSYTSSSSAPSSSAGTSQTIGGYSYLGCYTEPSSVRALPAVLYADDGLTVEKCATYCAGYSYFGLEYSRECWCGNAISSASQMVTDSQCSMLCDGNQQEYCGGPDRLNIYGLTLGTATLAPVTTSSVTSSVVSSTTSAAATAYPSLGCYSEATNTRALNSDHWIDYSSTGVSVERCATYCEGYTLFGLEYSGECYCGNALQTGSVAESDSDCYMPCDGDSSEICGGPDRLSVYYYPSSTPNTSCNNIGLQFAAFAEDPEIINTDGVYSLFDPTIYKTQPAELTGTTTAVSYSVTDYTDDDVPIYGSDSTFGSFYLVIDHRGYLFAQASGTYTFSTQSVDDLFLLWIGSHATSGWTRENANLEGNLYYQQVSFTMDLVAGQYYPLRFLWVNGDGPGNFEFSVTAPDGTIVLDADTVDSPYIVQFSCDGSTAPAYPTWGSET